MYVALTAVHWLLRVVFYLAILQCYEPVCFFEGESLLQFMPHFAHEVIDKGFDMLPFDKEMFLLMAQLFVIVDVFLVAVNLARKVLDILTGGLVVVTLIMMGIGIGLMVMDTLYGNDTKTQQHK